MGVEVSPKAWRSGGSSLYCPIRAPPLVVELIDRDNSTYFSYVGDHQSQSLHWNIQINGQVRGSFGNEMYYL